MRTVREEIATKIFGWHVVEVTPPEVLKVDGHTLLLKYELVDGQGETIPGHNRWTSEINCWEHAPYPQWDDDLHEALRLADLTGTELRIIYQADAGWFVSGRGIETETAIDEIAVIICGMVVLERRGKDNSRLKWTFTES